MNSVNHGTDEMLELHTLGRLPEADAAILEDHLLICNPCRDKFEQIESFALAMRDALRQEPVAIEKPVRETNWFAWLRRPSFQFAGALAFILLLGVLFLRPGSRAVLPVASIQLSALRGEVATVPTARELNITLNDAPDTAGPFKVEMVDGTGRNVWTGAAPKSANSVNFVVHLDNARVNRVEPGTYFVRLYAENGSLFHEYGVRVVP